MYRYEIRPQAEKNFKKLPKDIQQRILKKLEQYIVSSNPLIYADSLTNSALGQYRFRIGTYRVIFDLEGETIIILRVGHRKEIYRS